MSVDFTTLAPTSIAPVKRTRTVTKDKGPNPFIKNGWLKPADKGKWLALPPVAGEVKSVQKTVRRGGHLVPLTKDSKPVMIERYDGDIKTLVTLLREAAAELNCGVSVKVEAEKNKQGKPTGKFILQYAAAAKKVRKQKETAAAK